MRESGKKKGIGVSIVGGSREGGVNLGQEQRGGYFTYLGPESVELNPICI